MESDGFDFRRKQDVVYGHRAYFLEHSEFMDFAFCM